jgi:hypothetical protein
MSFLHCKTFLSNLSEILGTVARPSARHVPIDDRGMSPRNCLYLCGLALVRKKGQAAESR